MFEDEDDILVRCEGPNCSLRSADYEIPGVPRTLRGSFPWCPSTTFRAKPATVIGVDVSDEDKNFISMTLLEEVNYADLTIQRGPVGDSAKKKTRLLRKSGECSLMRNWRTWNLTSASTLEEWKGDLWWYDTLSSIGTGRVHVSRLLRCCDWGWRQRFCWPRRDVIFRAGGRTRHQCELAHTSLQL